MERRSGSRWVKLNKKAQKKCALDIDDLREDEEVELRVCAENEAGVGKPSDTCAFKAKDPFSVPGKPEPPIIEEVTKEGASLSWSPPTKDGGSPITNYILEMRRVGDIKWQAVPKDKNTDTKYQVPNLAEDVDFEFRVAAENKAGAGPPSDPSKPAKYSEFKTSFTNRFTLMDKITFLFSSHLFYSTGISPCL